MENIITLFEYHIWATNRMLSYVEEIGNDLFNKEVNSVFSSIRETMEHIYTVDLLWFDRIQAKTVVNEKVIFSNCSEALDAFNNLHNLMLSFLKQANLNQIVYYQNSTGATFENKMQDLLYHLVNHGTYHRGNITAMIRTLGSKSISTDYIYYLREKQE